MLNNKEMDNILKFDKINTVTGYRLEPLSNRKGGYTVLKKEQNRRRRKGKK